jgi:hypothetical protein
MLAMVPGASDHLVEDATLLRTRCGAVPSSNRLKIPGQCIGRVAGNIVRHAGPPGASAEAW